MISRSVERTVGLSGQPPLIWRKAMGMSEVEAEIHRWLGYSQKAQTMIAVCEAVHKALGMPPDSVQYEPPKCCGGVERRA